MMNGLNHGRPTETDVPRGCPSAWRPRTGAMIAMIGCLIAAPGCIERTITINTEPEEATIFLNDQEVGRSPVVVPFTWYGDYDIIVRKDGYKTLQTHHRVVTPWYELPGIEIITECLIPFTVHDDHVLDTFVLQPMELPTKDALLEAAAEMRRRAGFGTD